MHANRGSALLARKIERAMHPTPTQRAGPLSKQRGFGAHEPTAAEDGSLRSMTAGTATDALCSAANPLLAITRINMSPLAEKSTRERPHRFRRERERLGGQGRDARKGRAPTVPVAGRLTRWLCVNRQLAIWDSWISSIPAAGRPSGPETVPFVAKQQP
jgi:hypothetical protein